MASNDEDRNNSDKGKGNGKGNGNGNGKGHEQPQQEQMDTPPGSWIVHHDVNGQPFWRNNEHGQTTYHLCYIPCGPDVTMMTPHQQPNFVPAFAAPVKNNPKDTKPNSNNPNKAEEDTPDTKKNDGNDGKNDNGDDGGKWPPLPNIIRMYEWEEFIGPLGKKFWRHYKSGALAEKDPYV